MFLFVRLLFPLFSHVVSSPLANLLLASCTDLQSWLQIATARASCLLQCFLSAFFFFFLFLWYAALLACCWAFMLVCLLPAFRCFPAASLVAFDPATAACKWVQTWWTCRMPHFHLHFPFALARQK